MAVHLRFLLLEEAEADRLTADPVEGLRRDAGGLGVDEGEVGVLVGAAEDEGGEGAADHVGGADAVAGVAGGYPGTGPGEGGDSREVGRGGVDRAAPGVGDAAAAEGGEVVVEVLGCGSDDVGVDLGAALGPAAHRDPAASPAEGDAAVAGGAEVVEQRTGVGDAVAVGPADLLQ